MGDVLEGVDVKKFLIIMSAFILASCFGGGDQAEAKRTVAAMMKDISSVEFKNFVSNAGYQTVSDETFLYYCGSINAKNSFCGYKGYDEFVYSAGTKTVYLKSE